MNCIARSSGTLTMFFSSKYCSLVTAVQEHITSCCFGKKIYCIHKHVIRYAQKTWIECSQISNTARRTCINTNSDAVSKYPSFSTNNFGYLISVNILNAHKQRSNNNTTGIVLYLHIILFYEMKMCAVDSYCHIYVSIALPNPQSTIAVSKFPAYVGCISLIHSIVRNSHAICRRWVNNKSIWLNYIGMRQLHKWQICYPPYKSCCILSIGSYAIPLVRVRGVRTHLPCNLINSQRKHKTIPCLFEC